MHFKATEELIARRRDSRTNGRSGRRDDYGRWNLEL